MTTKDRHPSSKINQLLQQWPRGTVATYPWLKERGISRQLVGVYKRYHWLTPVGRGAFVRTGEAVTWPGAPLAKVCHSLRPPMSAACVLVLASARVGAVRRSCQFMMFTG